MEEGEGKTGWTEAEMDMAEGMDVAEGMGMAEEMDVADGMGVAEGMNVMEEMGKMEIGGTWWRHKLEWPERSRRGAAR